MDEERLRQLLASDPMAFWAMQRAPSPSAFADIPSDQGYIDSGPGPGAFTSENMANTADSIGDFAFGMTGIPMAAKAGEDMAAYDTDPWRAARGLGEAGVAMMPYGGSLTKAIMSSTPRLAAAATAAGAIPNLVTEAEAKQKEKYSKKNQKRSVVEKPAQPPRMPDPIVKIPTEEPAKDANGEPNVVDLAARRDPRVKILSDEKKRLETIIDTETYGRGGFGAKAQAAKKDLDAVNAKLQEAIDPYLPFDQKFPGITRNLQAVQFGIPALVALATRGMGRAALNVRPSRLNQAVKQGEEAYHGGLFSRPDMAKADQKLLEVQAHLRRMRRDGNPGEFAATTALPVAAGAVTGAELSVIPEQYNRRNTLPGTKEHDTAQEKLGSLGGMVSTMAPGAIMGGLGALTATHAIPSLRRDVPDIERADAFAKLVKGGGGQAAKSKAKALKDEAALASPPPASPTATASEKPKPTPRDKWWKATINKMRKSQAVDEAINAIDSDPDLARLNKPRRRKIITDLALQNPNATPQELAKLLKSKVAKLKKSGRFYSGAIGASLGAENLLNREDE